MKPLVAPGTFFAADDTACPLSFAFYLKIKNPFSWRSSEVFVKSYIERIFGYYFPSAFEMFIIGGVFFVISLPGIGMLFMHHDAIFPSLLGRWGDIAVASACVIGLLGITLIFCGLRHSALPGTLIYRLTHLR